MVSKQDIFSKQSSGSRGSPAYSLKCNIFLQVVLVLDLLHFGRLAVLFLFSRELKR